MGPIEVEGGRERRISRPVEMSCGYMVFIISRSISNLIFGNYYRLLRHTDSTHNIYTKH